MDELPTPSVLAPLSPLSSLPPSLLSLPISPSHVPSLPQPIPSAPGLVPLPPLPQQLLDLLSLTKERKQQSSSFDWNVRWSETCLRSIESVERVESCGGRRKRRRSDGEGGGGGRREARWEDERERGKGLVSEVNEAKEREREKKVEIRGQLDLGNRRKESVRTEKVNSTSQRRNASFGLASSTRTPNAEGELLIATHVVLPRQERLERERREGNERTR